MYSKTTEGKIRTVVKICREKQCKEMYSTVILKIA